MASLAPGGRRPSNRIRLAHIDTSTCLLHPRTGLELHLLSFGEVVHSDSMWGHESSVMFLSFVQTQKPYAYVAVIHAVIHRGSLVPGEI